MLRYVPYTDSVRACLLFMCASGVSGVLGVLGGARAVPLADAAHVGGVHLSAAVREVLGAAARGPHLPHPALSHRAHPRAPPHLIHTYINFNMDTSVYNLRAHILVHTHLRCVRLLYASHFARGAPHGFDAAACVIGLFPSVF